MEGELDGEADSTDREVAVEGNGSGMYVARNM